MAGIKNWTVTVETVKSVAAREVYFENADEPSHTNSESLKRIWGSEANSMRMMRLCEEAKAKQKAKRKGGRPPTPALEFVFVLPSDLEPKGSDKDWQDVTKDMIVSLARSLDVSPKELSQVCRGSLHREPQTAPDEEPTKGTHIHLMVGKILPCGTPMPKLQQKKALHEVKQAFNSSVFRRLGYNHEMYVARSNSNKKRYKNKWFANNAKLSKAVSAVQRCCTNLTKYTIDCNAMRILSTERRLDKALQELEELKSSPEVKIEQEQSQMIDLLMAQVDRLKEQGQESIELTKKMDQAPEEIKRKPKRDKNGTIVGWVEDK